MNKANETRFLYTSLPWAIVGQRRRGVLRRLVGDLVTGDTRIFRGGVRTVKFVKPAVDFYLDYKSRLEVSQQWWQPGMEHALAIVAGPSDDRRVDLADRMFREIDACPLVRDRLRTWALSDVKRFTDRRFWYTWSRTPSTILEVP